MPTTNQHRRKGLKLLKPLPLLPLLRADADVSATVQGNTDGAEIECLPSDELVGGYHRWLALCEAGVEDASVVVRDDLGGMDRDVIGLHALGGYVVEVKADDVTRAQLFRVWDRWRRSLPSGVRHGSRRRTLDREIQEVLGVSRRTLLRRQAVQTLPLSVVDELATLELSQGALERIACLSAFRREKILEELRGATDPRGVLARYFPNFRSKRHKKTEVALAAFARGLEAGITDLDERKEVAARLAGRHAQTLRDARRLIDVLLGDTAPAADAAGARP